MGSLKLNSHFAPEATSRISKGKESSHPSINFEWRNWLLNFTESVSLPYQITPTWNAKNLDANHPSWGCTGSMSDRVRFLSHMVWDDVQNGKTVVNVYHFHGQIEWQICIYRDEYNSMCTFFVNYLLHWMYSYICTFLHKSLRSAQARICPGILDSPSNAPSSSLFSLGLIWASVMWLIRGWCFQANTLWVISSVLLR